MKNFLVFVALLIGHASSSIVFLPDGSSQVLDTPYTSFGPRQFNVSGTLVFAEPLDGCSPLINNVSGKIVYVGPNKCYPNLKAKNVENAGGIVAFLSGYRDTLGLLHNYHGPNDEPISIPVVEVWRSDEFFKGGFGGPVNVTATPSPNPIVEFGKTPWVLFTVLLGIYDMIILGVTIIKLVGFYRVRETTDPLPFWILGFTIVTCLVRIPILVDPNSTRGVLNWGPVEAFLTLDFTPAIVCALFIALHFDIGVRRMSKGMRATGFDLSGRGFKIFTFSICGTLLVVEIVTSVMRARFFPAMPFLMGKVILYVVSSIFVSVYFFTSGKKIVRIASELAGTLPEKMKKKAYIGFGVSICLILFPITAFLVATPMYDPPGGYFMLRFLASFWLYTACLLLVCLLDPKTEIKTEAKFSATAASLESLESVPD